MCNKNNYIFVLQFKKYFMKKPIKTCKNLDCGDEIIDYKSSKRKYCSDYCRNHDGYNKRLQENEEFNTFKKGMKENYVVLKMFLDKNIASLNFELAEKLGFNTKYLPEQKYHTIEGKKTAMYTIKDILFYLCNNRNAIVLLRKNE